MAGRIVAFVGLGTMGNGMAACLVRAGFEVRGFDLVEDRLTAFSNAGGTACTSIAEACEGAEVVMTILPRDAHVEAVYLGGGGILESATPGTLALEMSTIQPSTSLAVATALEEVGLRMMDAPVGRTPEDAHRGTLLVMAGGSADDFTEAQPFLDAVSDKAVHLGPLGSGLRMKLANNYMSMVSMVLTAETLAMVRKAGIDSDAAVEVLQNTTAGRGQINVNYPKKVLAGDLSPDFPLSMGDKDISLGMALGRELGVPLFLGGPARELFGLAPTMDLARLDCTAMLILLERLAGLSDRGGVNDG